MAKSEVKLIGAWPSPFVMRPRIALNIKSVDYEFLEETFGSKSQLLLESNPVYKKIPVLIHEGKPICESLIIVQYIDEFWSSAPSILPSDPYDRATARFWASYVDDKFFPSMRNLRGAEGEAKDEAIKQVKEGLLLLEEALAKCSKGKPFYGGDEIGYVDIAFGSCLGWFRVAELSLETQFLTQADTPNLFNWAHSFSSHPAVKDVLPDTPKLAEFAKQMAAKIKAAPST